MTTQTYIPTGGYTTPPNPIFLLGTAAIEFAIAVVFIVAAWKMYKKAGFPGWAAIVPIYNLYILLKIVGRPGWWLLLYFIPIVNIVIQIIVALDLAKAFGKGALFGFFLNFLIPIGYLILGFGSAQYSNGNVPTPPTPTPAPAVMPAQNQTPPSPSAPQPNQ